MVLYVWHLEWCSDTLVVYGLHSSQSRPVGCHTTEQRGQGSDEMA